MENNISPNFNLVHTQTLDNINTQSNSFVLVSGVWTKTQQIKEWIQICVAYVFKNQTR